MKGSLSPTVLEMMISYPPRTRTILLPEIGAEDNIQTIVTNLRETESILSFQINHRQLIIEYAFPELTFAVIWKKITDQIDYRKFSTLARWKYNLLAYLETNEQQHLLWQDGWQKYIADIYVAHHYINRQDFNKKKLWQNYNKSANQGRR